MPLEWPVEEHLLIGCSLLLAHALAELLLEHALAELLLEPVLKAAPLLGRGVPW
ncbi:MAG: hypothetical protein PVH10_01515 [Methyloceanibacter sp.]